MQCWNRTNCSTLEGWRATSALIAKSNFAECVFKCGCAGGVRTLDPQLMRLVSYLLLYRAWYQKVESNH